MRIIRRFNLAFHPPPQLESHSFTQVNGPNRMAHCCWRKRGGDLLIAESGEGPGLSILKEREGKHVCKHRSTKRSIYWHSFFQGQITHILDAAFCSPGRNKAEDGKKSVIGRGRGGADGRRNILEESPRGRANISPFFSSSFPLPRPSTISFHPPPWFLTQQEPKRRRKENTEESRGGRIL